MSSRCNRSRIFFKVIFLNILHIQRSPLILQLIDKYIMNRSVLKSHFRFPSRYYWTSYGRLVIKRCFAFFFFFFFSAATIPKLSPDGYARNLARIRLPVQGSLCFWNFLKKSKNQVTTSEKHRKIGNFFDPRLTFSLAVEKRLKLFEKSFRRSKPG